MKYCWEVYNKSECDNCHYYKSFTEGLLNIDKDIEAREIVLVTEELTTTPEKPIDKPIVPKEIPLP